VFIEVLFTIAKKYPSIDEWIEKIWYTYSTECYSAIKGKELFQLQQCG